MLISMTKLYAVSKLYPSNLLGHNEICDSQFVTFANEQNQKRERVVQSIVTVVGFAPELVTEIFDQSSHAGSHSSGSIFRDVYTVLSQKFNATPSDNKFNSFVEAITEITIAEDEACSGLYDLSTADIPGIVMKFNHAFSASRSGDVTEVRALYGQMLCIKRQEENSPGPDNKRRRSSDCDCPSGGLEDSMCTCQFFDCLDPNQHLKPILGFVDWDIQCLAFVIDTTGSMGQRIAGAKKILKDFIKAEEDLNFTGCYLLVPYNDVGPDEAHVYQMQVSI